MDAASAAEFCAATPKTRVLGLKLLRTEPMPPINPPPPMAMKMLSMVLGLLEQFEPDGPLPGNDLGIVVGRHIDETSSSRLLLRMKLRQSALGAMQDHVDIVGADFFELRLGDRLGQNDGQGLADRGGSLRRGDAVVARRGGDDRALDCRATSSCSRHRGS